VSDEYDRLRRGYLESLAAAHILACKHVVDPHHIVARFLESCPVVVTDVPRSILLLGSLHPADVVIIPLAAERA